jgi:hypothetical protein
MWGNILSHIGVHHTWDNFPTNTMAYDSYCNSMILRSSVTLMEKINNAKPNALLFNDGQGIFNRQFSSLMSMTYFLIGTN